MVRMFLQNRSFNFEMGMSSKIFWGVFFFAGLVAVLVQFFVLPVLFPQFHSGHGILGLYGSGGDLVYFHDKATEIALAFREEGFSALRNTPFGGPHLAFFGFIYGMTVTEPYVLIPINALVHGLSALLIFHCFLLITKKERISLLATLPFVIFPTAMFWYAQIHRDGLSILGFLLYCYGWGLLAQTTTYRSFSKLIKATLIVLSSLLPLAISRPYLSELHLIMSSILVLPLIIGVLCVERFKKVISNMELVRGLIVLFLLVIALHNFGGSTGLGFSESVYQEHIGLRSEIESSGNETAPNGKLYKKHWGITYGSKLSLVWEPSSWLPKTIDQSFHRLNRMRKGFIDTAPEAHTSIDVKFMPTSAWQSLLFLPWAWRIGFFAPFPSYWSSEKGIGFRSIMRTENAIEMLFIYISFPFFLYFMWIHRTNTQFVTIFLLSFSMLSLFSYVNTNAGTLHRSRYGYLMLIVGMGLMGIDHLYGNIKNRRKTPAIPT